MSIRRQPADFLVVEQLDGGLVTALVPEAGRQHPCAVYRLHKTGLTTPEAVGQLSKALGANPAAVGYGGLKDKHAQTTQHVSITASSPQQAARFSASLDGPQARWRAERIGWTDKPLDSGSIAANRFTLVVRDLSQQAAGEMHRRAGLLRDGEGLLLVNYFGAQRFGSARHGQGWIARHLLGGEFETALKLAIATPARKDSGKTRTFTRLAAGKWGDWKGLAAELPRMPERRPIEALAMGATFAEAFAQLPSFLQALYLEAFQSHLWNRTAFALIGSTVPEADCLTTDDEYGPMNFPKPPAVPAALHTLDLPMIAPGVELTPPWGEAAAAALHPFMLTPRDFRIPGLKRPFFGKALRPLFTRAQGFTMSRAEPDDLTPKRYKVSVQFDLPRGSYATVVLRALGQ